MTRDTHRQQLEAPVSIKQGSNCRKQKEKEEEGKKIKGSRGDSSWTRKLHGSLPIACPAAESKKGARRIKGQLSEVQSCTRLSQFARSSLE